MKQHLGLAGIVALGLSLAVATPASAATHTVYVPDDFVKSLSDTRATGLYEVASIGLRIWTEGSTTTDRVAEYVATNTLPSSIGEPRLECINTSGGAPGFRLYIDANADDQVDGILVGESAHANDWWLNNRAEQFVKDDAPSHTTGYGSTNHGTLEQWRAAFPHTMVRAFGFSLGSGMKGDSVINAVHFAGTR